MNRQRFAQCFERPHAAPALGLGGKKGGKEGGKDGRKEGGKEGGKDGRKGEGNGG